MVLRAEYELKDIRRQVLLAFRLLETRTASVMKDVTLYSFCNDARSPITLFMSWSTHNETVTIIKNRESWMVIERKRTSL